MNRTIIFIVINNLVINNFYVTKFVIIMMWHELAMTI